jgi:tRNA modification GTPase
MRVDMNTETICAIATPPGCGGVGVVRVSGPLAVTIAQAMTGPLPPPRTAAHRTFRDTDGVALDDGLVLYFPAPHSFTGEAVVELQGHGSPVALDMLLHCAVRLGARLARPGEFSERAFLNGKLDLAQAEAIADLIHSQTESAARAAVRLLKGEFSARIHALVEAVIHLRMYVESAIDFADEEIELLQSGDVRARTQAVIDQLQMILAQSRQGVLLRDGVTLVIAGQPNAGKSSLLNRLAGYEAAIVTAIPGTTRDVVRERIQIEGIPVTVLDTAGIRDTHDTVEQEGVRRAREAMQSADQVVLVVDGVRGFDAEDERILAQLPPRIPVTAVYNKVDLLGGEARMELGERMTSVWLSAQRGDGLTLLRQHLARVAGIDAPEAGGFLARRRHVEALEHAMAILQQGCAQLDQHGASELLAEDLRHAQQHLNSITGEFTTDDLLGRIFSTFCIGK